LTASVNKHACHLDRQYDTYSHMKTTVHIPDALLAQAKHLASQEQTTVRALIEEGLRRILVERKAAKPFKLRRVTFPGKGLQPRMAGAGWRAMRDTIYKERGA